VHLRHLNPLPRNLGEVLARYKQVLVPEMNMGQLVLVLRAKYLIDARGCNKIQGKPFQQAEIEAKIEEALGLREPAEPMALLDEHDDAGVMTEG
jgi:2-oxoglutarate ferredoxin oxidoreductase subunit alpha